MKWCFPLILILTILSCRDDQEFVPVYVPGLMEVPLGFPEVTATAENEFTEQRWALGKKLFLILRSPQITASAVHPVTNLPWHLVMTLILVWELKTDQAPAILLH